MEVPAGNGPTEVPMPILNDDIKENKEQYFVGVLGISGDSTGAEIGDINTTLLIIADDEGKCTRFGLRMEAEEANPLWMILSKSFCSPHVSVCAICYTSRLLHVISDSIPHSHCVVQFILSFYPNTIVL